MKRNSIIKQPFLPERGGAWVFTVLLSMLLTATIICTLAVRMMTSSELHLAIATGDDTVQHQTSIIHDRIDLIAEAYGFDAESVKKAVSTDEIRNFNKETAAWWSTFLIQGKMKDAPIWYSSEIEESLYNADRSNNPAEDPQFIAEDLTTIIQNTLFPFRDSLMNKGNSILQDSVDVPNIIRTLRRLPLLGFAACLLMAGMIALFLGRGFYHCLKHYGTAMAAAGLTSVSLIILILLFRPGRILAEGSIALADVVGVIASYFGTRIGLAAVGLIVAGFVCLILYRRIINGKETQELPE